ncbi:MAG TPA: glutamate formimidoyltransferase [Thermoplasmata archaeon]|nr:glutamate formimidoyltransferase [Thermoplasmata archaeon]
MRRLVECVPNFSEGRRREVVDAIAAAIAAVPGVRVLDREMDAAHNRCVITFVGEPEPIGEAAFQGARKAVELIDMEQHHGEHPRVGALDVLPFVPVSGVTLAECVQIAQSVGKRLGTELQIPVYFYESAATRPDRKALPDVRKGEYEGLKREIETNPDRKPDAGPAKMHPTAGASIVGARPPLIAYNVNLATTDLALAKRIAKAIRERDGGLPAVRALGMELKDRGQVQVSINLVDFTRTGMHAAFEAVRREAEKAGVQVAGSEIVGLVPLAAVADVTARALQLEGFHVDQILETRLEEG